MVRSSLLDQEPAVENPPLSKLQNIYAYHHK